MFDKSEMTSLKKSMGIDDTSGPGEKERKGSFT
jgi:hypothetical protein